MPRKAMFTREDFISAAFEIARERGIDAVTARELGGRLGCSSRPMFTFFRTVEELKSEVSKKAIEIYRETIKRGLSDSDALHGFWNCHIGFAQKEPMLFRLIFSENKPRENQSVPTVLELIDEIRELLTVRLVSESGISEEDASNYFNCFWLLANGTASFIAVSGCRLTEDESEALYRRAVSGFLAAFKPSAIPEQTPEPSNQTDKTTGRGRRFEEWID